MFLHDTIVTSVSTSRYNRIDATRRMDVWFVYFLKNHHWTTVRPRELIPRASYSSPHCGDQA